jgi:hypothetical protein
MEASPGSRCGDIASDISTILVTIAQLIFLTFFHEYIAWYSTGPDGSVTRLSMLTDDYFTWLPLPITASILVIVALAAMVIYDRYWLRQAAWAVFSILGIAVVVSLVCIFPFNFSVIPNPVAADIVPVVVTVFLILMAAFYAVAALVQFVRIVKGYRMERNRP